MAGLSSALSSALSGLLVSSSQSALVSRNVTRAGDQNYSRREVSLSANGHGMVALGSYSRSADKSLQARVLNSSSQSGSAQVIIDALMVLSTTIGDPQDKTSVAAGLFALQQSMRDFQNNPSSATYASGATAAARTLATRLNQAAEEVARVREGANAGVKASVDHINSLLSELQPVEQSIRSGKAGTETYLENLDSRDSILKQLSEEIGLRVVNRSDGGIALYTDSGISLFDGVPRKVEITNDSSLSPGLQGPSVFIDNVEVTGPNPVLPLQQGRLAAQLALRDEISLTYEAQLDETARSLITLFAEEDQSSTPTLPQANGIFTYGGAPGVPAAATHAAGLARQIGISTVFDDRAGGNPMLLRDGGSNGSAYGYNAAGQSGFQQRLSDLADSFDSPFSFDVSAGLAAPASIKTFAITSASKLESERAKASQNYDQATAVNQRWTEALLSKTGVNLDAEMATLLSLEKSYQASAKVLTTIDQMFATLVDIVR
jgi:flagellar hook-associated protein 1